MIESLYRDFRQLPLGQDQHHQPTSVVRFPEMVWVSSVSIVDLPTPHGLSPAATPDAMAEGPHSHRAKTSDIAPLTAIRRIFATIRRWRERAGARARWRETSDHLLKDIGLRREVVGYEAAKPFAHRD